MSAWCRAPCFADFGHEVVCVDTDQGKIDRLHEGIMPIYEPGLDALVAGNVAAGRLAFTTSLAAGIAGADAIFIAVGTPSRRGDGHADLSFVHAVAREIGAALAGDAVVVTKSTVPVGTGDEVERIIDESGTAYRVSVVSNPEFLREGAAIEDFKRPDRIVIGADDDRGREVMREIYRPLFLNESPILFTSRRSAELIKYAANAFLATKITFINEMADLCEQVGADVQDVARGIGMDNRIGSKFLHAGPGYGGSCFPKDTLGAPQDGGGCGQSHPHRRGGGARERRTQARDGAQGAGRAGRGGRGAGGRRPRCWASPSSPTPTTCATARRSPSPGR